MHAIDGPGSINGRFTEGNPATGQDATMVTCDWLNDFQANLLAVLSEGKVTPTKGRAADLLDAIKAVAGGIQGGGGGAVPTTRKIGGAGLATVDGDGDLSQDRTVTVKRATAAQIVAGEADDAGITPKGLFDALSAQVGANGSYPLFGGLILKWGTVAGLMGEGAIYTAFPVAFPNACFVAFPIGINATAGRNRDVWAQLVDRGKAGFTTMVQWTGNRDTNSTLDGFDYIALGN
ncbi:hypothetical protein [Sphingomonas sp.]|uniref:gp53-like domain-containing protein n=1 Tax=Sphingomonas sp. TaxID=28214 RepID=UPI0031CF95E8